MTPTEPCYVYRAEIARVIDGDTFVADVDLGFNSLQHVTVRVRGVNAPEKRAPGGAEATEFLVDYGDTPMLIQSYRDQMSFARWVCDVYVPDGKGGWLNLAEEIVKAGHGVVYHD